MEEWNTVRLVFKRILAISILSSTQILPLTQYSIMPEPIIPAFHHSNWGEAPKFSSLQTCSIPEIQ
jgi:hypothetical protein